MSSSDRIAGKTAASVTLVILLSKAAGFVRDMISSGYFATGMERDAYTSAYSLFYLPVLLLSSCITSTVVPLYIDARANRSIREANRFASTCVNFFALISFALCLIMLIFAKPLVGLVYGGFELEKQALTTDLFKIMLPSLACVSVSIVMASVLNANERYIAAQLTGFPLTVAVIVATVFFSRAYGIRAVAWGVFAAGILQLLILLPSISRSMRYSFSLRLKSERFTRLFRLAIPAVISMAVNELNHMIDKSLASYLRPGDISAMDYAYRLITFAIGVLAVPLTTIMFSQVSKHAAERDEKGIVRIVGDCVGSLTLVLLPVTAIGWALSRDIISLAYMHGKFGEDSLIVTSSVFGYYLVGILAFGLRDMFNRAFHAMQDTKTPMIAAYITVALNIGLDFLLSKLMGANGLALATSISCAVGAALLLIALTRRVKYMKQARMGGELIKMAIAAAACLAAALLLNGVVPQATGKLYTFLRLFIISMASLCPYLVILYLLKVKQLRQLARIIRRRINR